eukprot:jgi/Tetstr1/457354/TSEL_043957.t1
MGLPRINSQDVLVVPPCECAWLSGEGFELKDSRGCVAFEARGGHDATIILRSEPGGKRFLTGDGAAAASYTVKFGSHRNAFLELERNGSTVFTVPAPQELLLSSGKFSSLWVNIADGIITVGRDAPLAANAVQQWQDRDPLPGIRYVGLSTWDNHMAYRNIRLLPPLTAAAAGAEEGAAAAEPEPRVPPLAQLCKAAVAAQLGSTTACELLAFTQGLLMPADSSGELRAAAAAAVAAHLADILAEQPSALCALSAESLRSVAIDSGMSASELDLFNAILTWGGFDGSSLSVAQPVEELLHYVRFPLMTEAELQAVRGHPVVRQSPALQKLLATAHADKVSGLRVHLQGRELQAQASEAAKLDSLRWQSRTPRPSAAAHHELMYLSDGDGNGLVSFLGTSGGAKPFVNPVLEQRLAVSCSSPPGRHCDPRHLASRKFCNTLTAGPRLCNGERSTWWALDLGASTHLAANYYTLRQDGSSNFPRSWALQASADGVTWTDLRRHMDDPSIRRPGQLASWPLPSRSASGFRHFRLLLTGPSASEHPAEQHCFSVCGLELYGNLYISP